MALPLLALTPRFKAAHMTLDDLTKKPQNLEFFEGKVMPTNTQLNSSQNKVSADEPANKLASKEALSKQSLRAYSFLLIQASLRTRKARPDYTH